MRVGRADVDLAVQVGDATVADLVALGGAVVLPQLDAGLRIDGPGLVRDGEVHDAINNQRRAFDGQAVRGKGPGEREGLHIGDVDFIQRAEAAAREVAVIGGPLIADGRNGLGCLCE